MAGAEEPASAGGRVRVARAADRDRLNPHGWEFFVPLPDLPAALEYGFGAVVVPFPRGQWSAYHRHPDAEVLIISVSGEAEGRIDGRSVKVHPGDFVYLSRGTPHAWKTTSDDPWISIGIHYPPVYQTDNLAHSDVEILKGAP